MTPTYTHLTAAELVRVAENMDNLTPLEQALLNKLNEALEDGEDEVKS